MSDEFKIRVRVSAPDPYAGLKSHAYIKARGLSPRFLAERRHQCNDCKMKEMEEVVLTLLENWEQKCVAS
jgi:hypothetical protein